MDATDDEPWKDYGDLQVRPAEERAEWKRLRKHFQLERWCWTPGPLVRDQLPPGFALELLCCTGTDGQRRVIPASSTEVFIRAAALGGLALLSSRFSWNPEQRRTYRTMQLLFSRVRGMREHRGRGFNWSRDVFVRPSARGGGEERTVLPPDLGLAADGSGHSWSVAELIRQGRALLAKEGLSERSRQRVISYGLYAAALQSPLQLAADQIPALVRAALFTSSPDDAVSDEAADVIEARLLSAVNSHLEDTPEKFRNWFSGPRNSLLKQLAQQRNADGGPFPVSAVRKVLLELGWRSYTYVAQCVDAQMRFVKAAIRAPLHPAEQRFYDLTYLEQPFLANLPLILLTERIPALQTAVRQFAPGDEPLPEETLHAICHRLLSYYVFMSDERRDADRRAQRRRRPQGHVGLVSSQTQRTDITTDEGLIVQVDSEIDEIAALNSGSVDSSRSVG